MVKAVCNEGQAQRRVDAFDPRCTTGRLWWGLNATRPQANDHKSRTEYVVMCNDCAWSHAVNNVNTVAMYDRRR